MKKNTAADPDLQIRKGGPGHPDPEIGGEPFSKIFFWPLGPQFGQKIMGGGEGARPPGPPPPSPSPRSATGIYGLMDTVNFRLLALG